MKKAFTLIEVLIVVLIIGILATLSLPQFSKMVRRSKLAEAWVHLGGIKRAESLYYAECQEYTNSLSYLDVDVSGSTNFEYSIEDDPSGSGYKAIARGYTTVEKETGYGTTITRVYTGLEAWVTANGESGSYVP